MHIKNTKKNKLKNNKKLKKKEKNWKKISKKYFLHSNCELKQKWL